MLVASSLLSGAPIACTSYCENPALAAREHGSAQGVVVFGVFSSDVSLLPTDGDCAVESLEVIVGDRRPEDSLEVAAMGLLRDGGTIIASAPDAPAFQQLESGPHIACRSLVGESARSLWCVDFTIDDGDVLSLVFDFSAGGDRFTAYREETPISDSVGFDLLNFVDSCFDASSLEEACSPEQPAFPPDYCIAEASNFDDCNYGVNIQLNDEYFRCVAGSGQCVESGGSQTFEVPDTCVWTGC